MLAARENSDALKQWKRMGGDAALASYAHLGDGELTGVPDAHWEFLQNRLLDYHELDDCFCVHASAHPTTSLPEQTAMWLHWESFQTPMGIIAPHESGKTMICGHTPQKNGLPAHHGHIICIDTYIHGGGWLTCLDLDTNDAWQANQQGETRRFEVRCNGG